VKNNKRDEIINYLKKKKIGCSVHYKPIHQLTYYRKKYKLENQSFPISTKWGKNCITLPFHLKLTLKDQYYVIKTLRKSLDEVKIFN